MTAGSIDAHHHLLYPAERRYPFLQEAPYRSLARRCGVDELEAALAPTTVERTVVVETTRSAEETERLLREADERPTVAGVVGWVDLAAPGVGEEIARLRAQRGGGRLVGVRHLVHDEPDPRWLMRPDVLAGLRAVAHAGLAYDLLVRPRDLAAAIELADALPELRLVVDHVAKPRIGAAGEALDAAWAASLRALAERPQVTCKLSGLVTEMHDGTPWSAEALRPYLERALAWFGPQRLMFGSDWPVCLLAASYAETFGLVRDFAVAELSPAERASVLGGTARAFYRLSA